MRAAIAWALASVAACGPRPPTEPVDNQVAAAPEGERGPVVLFAVYGTVLIPAICSERPGSLSAGAACLALLGDSVDVRTPRGKLETARRGSFECGPTEEVTAVYELPGERGPRFAVSPAGEETAHLERAAIPARAVEPDPDGIFAGGDPVEAVATSDIDGDGVREALIDWQGGEDSGSLLLVVRYAPGRATEILFRWECRS